MFPKDGVENPGKARNWKILLLSLKSEAESPRTSRNYPLQVLPRINCIPRSIKALWWKTKELQRELLQLEQNAPNIAGTPVPEDRASEDAEPQREPGRRGRKPGSGRRRAGKVGNLLSPANSDDSMKKALFESCSPGDGGIIRDEGITSGSSWNSPYLSQKLNGSSSNPAFAQYKQAVLETLREYRKEKGLGCFKGLAKKAGIKEDHIRFILASQKVSNETWRKLGKALGVKPGKDLDGGENK